MRSGNVEDQLTEVDSFNAVFKFEKLQRRNLGETTIRTDEVFAGCEGKVKLRVFTESWLIYLQALEARARRQGPYVTFNFVTTLVLPERPEPHAVTCARTCPSGTCRWISRRPRTT